MSRLIRVLIVLLLTAAGLSAQEPTVLVSPAVRVQLAASWDLKNPMQRERAYCLSRDPLVAPGGDTAWVVLGAVRSTPISEDPYAVGFWCPDGASTLHVHTPTTCSHDELERTLYPTCAFGGADAWNCQPSEADKQSLAESGAPFALIQCDQKVIVAYFPLKR